MTKALLVIDMVKGFLNAETGDGPCKLYLKGAREAIVPNILRELRSLKEDDIVVYLCDAHYEDDEEFDHFPPHCIEETEESELIDELPVEEENDLTDALCYRLNKRNFDGFIGTELEDMLDHFEVEELILVGVVTEICVAETAKGARYSRWPVTIVKDCVWPLNREDGERVLSWLQKNMGVRIAVTAEPVKDAVVIPVPPPPPKPVEAPKLAIPVEPTTPPKDANASAGAGGEK